MPKKIKKDFKFWLNIITLAALVFLVWVSRDQIREAFANLENLNLYALLFMLPLQLLNYYAVARIYYDFFERTGSKVRFKTLYSVALELNFINHVFPSGGVSGFSYLSLRLKNLGVSTAKSTLAQMLRFSLTFLSFLALLLMGMLILALRRQTSPMTILIATSIIFLTLFGTIVAIYIISNEKRIHAFASWLPRVVNKVLKSLHLRNTDIIEIERVERVMTNMHNEFEVISHDWGMVRSPFWWSLLANITEIATIYMVYVAFGTLINPGALILAYAVANFAGLIAVLPGGVGIYEGLMTATLSATGVNRVLALSATVVYRVLSMLVFLPIGYLLYHRALRHMGEEAERELRSDL